MTFSQYAGIAIVPTLSRLVLCAAFISTGWNKVFRDADFSADEANVLQTLGVTLTKTAMADPQDAPWRVVPASYRQDQDVPATSGGLRTPATQDAGDTPTTTTQPIVPAQSEPVAPAVSGSGSPAGTGSAPATSVAVMSAPPVAAPFHGRAVYKLAFMLNQKNFPKPVWQAWLAALTELVGGSMLLIGLFSRIWGLGLAITMSVAFYLVSIQMNHMHQMNPLDWATPENAMAFSTMIVQAGLFVLAFGIFLTGPGPLSLDRILFGGGRREEVVEAEVVEVRRSRD